MRLNVTALALTGLIGLGSLAAPLSAEAQQRYRNSAPPQGGTVIRVQDEDGRVRTRIVVQRRSYLDGGTEVLPGQRKFTDYISLPGQRPLDILGPGKGYDRQPLNGPFDYGFRNW
jgi:hypothetical protein